MSRLEGRVALVTGAGKGLGRAFCTRLAQEGADIVAVTRADMDGLEQTAKDVRELGRDILVSRVDVSSEADTEAMADKAIQKVRQAGHIGQQCGLLLRCNEDVFHGFEGGRVGPHDEYQRERTVALHQSRIPSHESPGQGQDRQPHFRGLLHRFPRICPLRSLEGWSNRPHQGSGH